MPRPRLVAVLSSLLMFAHAGAAPVSFKAHEKPVWLIAFSPDGQHLATAGNGLKEVKVWDAATRKLLHTFEQQANSLAFSADSKRLVVGGGGHFRLYDLGNGKSVQQKLEGVVTGLAASPDGKWLVFSIKESDSIQIRDPETGKPIKTLKVPMAQPAEGSGGISRVCFSDDGKLLVASLGGRGWPDFSGADSVLAVWEVPSWELRASFPADRHNLNDLAISPDGKRIAGSCHRSKWVRVWDMPGPRPKVKEFVEPDPGEVPRLLADLDSRDFDRREAAHRRLAELGPAPVEALKKGLTGSSSVEFRLRARRLLERFTPGDTSPTHTLRPLSSDVQAVAWSPGGKRLAIGHGSATTRSLSVWDASTFRRRITPAIRTGTWALAFSPDGKALAAGHADGTVTIRPTTELGNW